MFPFNLCFLILPCHILFLDYELYIIVFSLCNCSLPNTFGLKWFPIRPTLFFARMVQYYHVTRIQDSKFEKNEIGEG